MAAARFEVHQVDNDVSHAAMLVAQRDTTVIAG
jgi:hypothetical protein